MQFNFNNYCVIPFSEYRYMSFNIKYNIENSNFDRVLYSIGRYYYKMENASINKICSLIKDEINANWHLNRMRKKYQRNKVSTMQIKTIRRSFIRLKNKGQNYIRIPFNVIPILFYILHIFDSIDNNLVSDLKDDITQSNIGEYIYKDHWKLSIDYITINEIQLLNVENEYIREKYNYLIAQLTSIDSLLNQQYDRVDWKNINQENYKIKLIGGD